MKQHWYELGKIIIAIISSIIIIIIFNFILCAAAQWHQRQQLLITRICSTRKKNWSKKSKKIILLCIRMLNSRDMTMSLSGVGTHCSEMACTGTCGCCKRKKNAAVRLLNSIIWKFLPKHITIVTKQQKFRKNKWTEKHKTNLQWVTKVLVVWWWWLAVVGWCWQQLNV